MIQKLTEFIFLFETVFELIVDPNLSAEGS